MPFHQEATFHDRQYVTNEDPKPTSDTDFVDLPGATLTTKDLGVNGNYALAFSLLLFASLNNTVACFRLVVDGVPFNDDCVNITLKVKDADIGYTIHGVVPSIAAGVVLKAQFKTDKGTITVTDYNISMDGVSESRVI